MMNHSEYDMVYCSFLKHYSNGGSLVVPNNQIGFVSEILVDAYETQGSISYDGAAYYKAR